MSEPRETWRLFDVLFVLLTVAFVIVAWLDKNETERRCHAAGFSRAEGSALFRDVRCGNEPVKLEER